MMLNCDEFPLVYIRDHDHDVRAPGEPSWPEEMEALLGRNRPFVILFDAPQKHEQEETQEERREKAIWFKRNRARLTALCAGAIVIESNGPTPMPIRLAARAVGKAFGVEFRFVGDDKAAREVATTILEDKVLISG
ncbi:hypothetical protein OSH10_16740 [Kaistia defluvii]|uniref:hypothetical protein n=1 Tax=Kaistia defluvii TaxID=410841 RepID=UPI002256A3DE|nr:hypothetical protein [Kaistia defluvii]MCX5520090.1 hypothetical protein [Kaistia defluvii]